MRRIEDEMSEWKEKTFVSEINKFAGKRAISVPRTSSRSSGRLSRSPNS
jgi:hypothetical protein